MLENRQNIRKFKSYSFRKILQILRREENTRYFIIFDSTIFDFTEKIKLLCTSKGRMQPILQILR